MTEPLPPSNAPSPLASGVGMTRDIDPSLGEPLLSRRGIDTRGGSLREHTARGTIINTAFLVALSGLGLVRAFVLAALLTREDYGVWGVLVVSLGTLLWLKQVGISDKYIQQEDADQELAFQKAFTLEAIFTGGFVVLLAAAVPVFAAIYGEWEILAPGLLAVLALPATVLQAPLWIYYRKMEFLKQRALQAIDPVLGFIVAVVLAANGAGYWSLVAGLLVGAWATAIAALVTCPYKLRFRYDRQTLRSYFSFSWPLFLASGSSILIAQIAVVAGEATLGLAGVGAIALASNIVAFSSRVGDLITQTLYPAICAVRDRVHLLEESFVKSNRLALIWAIPFGSGLGLFGDDLVSFALGERWRPAVVILSITGFHAAFAHIAFNWDAYMRALDRTRPIAVASAASLVTWLVLGLPLLLMYGLVGLAVGNLLQSMANVACRVHYLKQVFHGFRYLRHASRAIVPTLPAIALVLVARQLWDGDRTAGMALAELAGYVLAIVLGTWLIERRLLREALSYLPRRRAAVAA